MKLSEMIIEYRREHGYSQRQFADICGLSNTYISFLEKEINPKTGLPIVPGILQLNKLATGMGMTTQSLLETVDDMPIDISSQSPAESVKDDIAQILSGMSEEQLAQAYSLLRWIKEGH